MTKADKSTIYHFIRTATAAVCGYVPTALQDAAPAFTDDVQDSAENMAPPPTSGKSSDAGSEATSSIKSSTAPSLRAGTAPQTTSANSPLPPAGIPPLLLQSISSRIASCTACPLCNGRTQTVPGMGVEHPVVLVVGEGPGHDEDVSGLPFVGPAGQLLDKMLKSISLDRHKNCYIANVVKCRPPHNRTPTPQEAAACLPFLNEQILILKPHFILAMGRTAGQALLGITGSLASMRGMWRKYNGIPMITTYHPSALLRDPSLKRFAWEDLKLLRISLLSECPDYAK